MSGKVEYNSSGRKLVQFPWRDLLQPLLFSVSTVGFFFVQFVAFVSKKQLAGALSIILAAVAFFLVICNRKFVKREFVLASMLVLIVLVFLFLTSPIEIRFEKGMAFGIRSLPAVYAKRDSYLFKNYVAAGNIEGVSFVLIEGPRWPAHIRTVMIVTVPL